MKADSKTESEIKAVLKTFTESYAKRDLNTLRRCLATDDDVLFYGTAVGEKRRGLSEMEMQAKQDWELSERASIVLESMSISGAGSVAWVAADGAMEYRAKGEDKDMHQPVRITFVLEKRDSAWLIVHAHFSIAAPDLAEGRSSARAA